MYGGTRAGLRDEHRHDQDPPFRRLCSVVWSMVTPSVSHTSFLRTAYLHLSSVLYCSSTSHLFTETGPLKHAARAINCLHAFIIKPTRCTNFPNLLWHETLHVSGSSSAHHREFIHCTLGFRAGPGCNCSPSWSCSKAVYKPL